MLGMQGAKLTIGRLARAAVCMDLVFQHITRNPEGVALCFSQHGRVHLVSPEGEVLRGGYELAGIASIGPATRFASAGPVRCAIGAPVPSSKQEALAAGSSMAR